MDADPGRMAGQNIELMKEIRTYHDLPDATQSDIAGQLAAKAERLRRRLTHVRHTLAVISGKGGVGKSLITANLAAILAARGLRVGVADADLNGPSMARLLGAAAGPLAVGDDAVEPATGAAGVKLMSMDLLLEPGDTPVNWVGPLEGSFVWRGTLEANTFREFLSDTDWGELDYLLLDTAPGADRIVSVHSILPELGGVVLVTLPSELSRFIVKKSLALSQELGIPIIGYVENMAGYVCPDCGAVGPLFEAEGQDGLDGVDRLVRIPFDPFLGRDTDEGRPGALERVDSPAARAFASLADGIQTFFED